MLEAHATAAVKSAYISTEKVAIARLDSIDISENYQTLAVTIFLVSDR